MTYITEVFCHCKPCEANAHTHPRSFIHLPEHECGFVDNAAGMHFCPKVIAFATAFADTCKHGISSVFGCNIVNQFLNQNCFTDTRTAEKADFSAFCIRSKQVDNLNAGFKNFFCCLSFCIGWGRAVNASSFRFGRQRFSAVHAFSENIEKPSENCISDGNRNRRTGGDDLQPAVKPFGRSEHDAADKSASDMLRNFHNTFFTINYNK